MSIFTQFTEAQTAAWDWLRSLAEEEYTASAGLKAYREAGGRIRTQDWYRTYNSYTAYQEIWATLDTFTLQETIPERFWLPAPRAFQETYVAEAEIALRNNFTGELQRTFRYIESPFRMSQSELEASLQEIGTDYPGPEQWNLDYIYGYKFYKKGE